MIWYKNSTKTYTQTTKNLFIVIFHSCNWKPPHNAHIIDCCCALGSCSNICCVERDGIAHSSASLFFCIRRRNGKNVLRLTIDGLIKRKMCYWINYGFCCWLIKKYENREDWSEASTLASKQLDTEFSVCRSAITFPWIQFERAIYAHSLKFFTGIWNGKRRETKK